MQELNNDKLSEVVLSNQIAAWFSGIHHEIDFWNRYIADRGGKWRSEFDARLDSRAENPEWVMKFLGLSNAANMRVLDVGSGPLTSLFPNFRGARMRVTAVDPLAPLYNAALDRNGITPVTRTEQGFAEDLTAVFDSDTFDAVHCRNALDHSFDPMRGIWQMLGVLKTGSNIFLSHFRNEAEEANYAGFHQWNFDEIDGRFVIWNRQNRIDVANALSEHADVLVGANADALQVSIRKKRPIDSASPQIYRRRVQELLGSFVMAAAGAKATTVG
ncbi:class I SAM-dependent methyltransferase [Shinella daejeonensis]|uniref:class I SAM-dependent methyltransferase n=1 Tax=Shinella daejeonensis TaxID=659017 RepID=UPI0020C7FD1F|nr:class I SAM-dependent methyltransferase [Shinella daejeonensis]MCP8894346.1 class I SAM-dependent methyltransferase [Shinella daejeonensis]